MTTPGDAVMWKRGTYYGTEWPDELAVLLVDEGQEKVQILCLDGEIRWVDRANVYDPAEKEPHAVY